MVCLQPASFTKQKELHICGSNVRMVPPNVSCGCLCAIILPKHVYCKYISGCVCSHPKHICIFGGDISKGFLSSEHLRSLHVVVDTSCWKWFVSRHVPWCVCSKLVPEHMPRNVPRHVLAACLARSRKRNDIRVRLLKCHGRKLMNLVSSYVCFAHPNI